jgi:hypothetical protein
VRRGGDSPLSRLTTLAACAAALAIPAAVAGCGGDDSEEDPQQVLQETFGPHDTEITSGVIDLTLEASAGDQGSFTASLSGPFQADPDDPGLPQLDLTAEASGEGTGESVAFNGGLVITDDAAFVEYNDQAYEAPQALFEQIEQAAAESETAADQASGQSFEQACERAAEQAGGDPSACDIDFEGWLADVTNEGTEDVEGTETIHVSADADVERILADLSELVSSALPPEVARVMDLRELEGVAPAISEAEINVYSGEEDRIPRRISLSAALDPGAVSGLPLPQIDLDFSATLSELNEEQTIEAPADAQPLRELLDLTGIDIGLDDELPGLDELQPGADANRKPDDGAPREDGGDAGTPEPEAPDDGGSGNEAPDGGAPDGGAPDGGAPAPSGEDDDGGLFGEAPGLSEQEQAVLDCISEAADVEELERCNDLLEQ